MTDKGPRAAGLRIPRPHFLDLDHLTRRHALSNSPLSISVIQLAHSREITLGDNTLDSEFFYSVSTCSVVLTCSLDGSWPAACSAYSSSCSRPTRGPLLPRQELREPVRITLSPPSVCVVQMPVRTSVLGLCLTQCCCTAVCAHPSRSRLRTPPAPGIPGASRPSIPLPQGWSGGLIW